MIRRFNRFELKYLVSVAQRDALRTALAENMAPDPHGEAGCYRVTSLYVDSPDRLCFWAKVEGIKYRRKVRLRVYGAGAAGDDTPVMAEIKQRINRTVQKRRLELPCAAALRLCAGEMPGGLADARDRQVAAEICFLASSLRLEPAVTITYLREAWLGSRYEPGLRLTFDSCLACRAPEHLLDPNAPAHGFLAEGQAVMEVKVNEAVPLWLVHLLARHDCRLRRISKYVAGLAALPDLSHPSRHQGAPSWTSC